MMQRRVWLWQTRFGVAAVATGGGNVVVINAGRVYGVWRRNMVEFGRAERVIVCEDGTVAAIANGSSPYARLTFGGWPAYQRYADEGYGGMIAFWRFWLEYRRPSHVDAR